MPNSHDLSNDPATSPRATRTVVRSVQELLCSDDELRNKSTPVKPELVGQEAYVRSLCHAMDNLFKRLSDIAAETWTMSKAVEFVRARSA